MFNLFFFTQVISYRQLHVLDETYVMNGCKEDCCYVAKDFDCEVGMLENSKALFHETKQKQGGEGKEERDCQGLCVARLHGHPKASSFGEPC